VTWADLRGRRFEQASFVLTVRNFREDANSPPTEVTDLTALRELDTAPSLNPHLIIAQSSRCGSTLLARIMATMDGGLTILEPGFLGNFLTHDMRNPEDFPTCDILREFVRALGRVRFGDEKTYVLKLSSPLTRFLPHFRRAFPRVPVVWLQRRPIEIVESNMRAPGRWIGSGAGGGDDLAALILKDLTVVFLAATAHVTDDMLVLDYRDLPDAAWTKVARFMGMTLSEAEIARMRGIASYDSKSDKPFERRPLSEVPEAVQNIVRQTLDPLYEALDRRRHVCAER
jgi:hypothetical protein